MDMIVMSGWNHVQDIIMERHSLISLLPKLTDFKDMVKQAMADHLDDDNKIGNEITNKAWDG